MLAISLRTEDQLYYTEFDEKQALIVDSKEPADLLITNLRQKLTIQWINNVAQVTIEETHENNNSLLSKPTSSQVITLPTDHIRSIDSEQNIALSVSKVSESSEHVYFDNNCRMVLGRSEKNDIVIKLPFISRHQMEFASRNGKLYIKDTDSTNGTFVNGRKISVAEIHPGDVIAVLTLRMIYDGNTLLFFNAGNSLTVKKAEIIPDTDAEQGTIVFERSMRLRNRINQETVLLPHIPSAGEKPEIDYLSTFLPAFVTVAIGLVMFFTMGNAMSLLYSLPMSLSGVIMSVVNYRKQAKKFKSSSSDAADKFHTDIKVAEEKLKSINARQLSIMNAENPEIPRLLNAAETRNAMLWNHRPDDEDFLNVRLGTGKANAFTDIRLESNSDSATQEYIRMCTQLKEKYSVLGNAPICTNIRSNHITGIVGVPSDTDKILENLLIQLAVRYCYTELRIVFFGKPEMNWVAKLPHADGLTAVNAEEANVVTEKVIELLKDREKTITGKSTYGKPQSFLPYILFIVSDPSLLSKNAATDKYVIDGERFGSGVIMSVESMNQLPLNSSAVIRMNGSEGELLVTENVSKKESFVIEQIPTSAVVHFANSLQNVRVREESSVDGSKPDVAAIPAKYSFYEMLGIQSAKELDLKKRWGESDVSRFLKAPLGIGEKGIVELDISGWDTADGPHGLVAGTTGSGKSETIVSYLLALTTFYSPLDLSLIIIDFKGGAMCNKFRGMPHLVGSITNLSGKEIERSLKTLDAEIKHRQQLMQEASNAVETHDIDSIGKYSKLFKTGLVKEPMPHLVIVADEFAELKAQYPEFLDKLVSVARIGRSLGIHLILATQKPAGQVSDQIWSNSKFRICLKVQSEQDSKDVIKTDLATKIKEAGRAYLMVGFNERFELLQSGFSGAKDTENKKLTQFNAVVNHIIEHCRQEHIHAMPTMFMAPLPEQAELPAAENRGDAASTVSIGIFDDPGHKAQSEHNISLSGNNLMIIGSSQMGKTSLLQTIIRGLAEQYSPSEVSIYILDFASQLLRKYADLNHVGGVVTSSEDEKLKHLMQLLDHEFEIRREKFSKAGVSSLAAYRKQGGKDIPQLIVMIDNLTGLKELYFQDDDELVRLCRDGLSVGITVIASNSNTKGIGYKYLSYFDSRVAFYNNDSSEYGNLFDHCRETVEKIPGRCLVMHDSKLLDCQTYLAFSDNSNDAISDFIAKNRTRYGIQSAPQIPELPASLTTTDLVKQYKGSYRSPYSIAMGLDYETVGPVIRNLKKLGCLSLAGGTPKAQSVYLRSIVNQLNASYPGRTKVWIIDSVDRLLEPLSALPNVVSYSRSAAGVPEIITDLEQKAKARMTILEFGDADALDDAELLVLIINNPSVADSMNLNKNALSSYGNLITKYKDMGICILTSNAPNASFIAAEFYKKTMENKQFLWFDNLPSLKIVTVPYAVSKKYAKKIGAGDAYLFNDTECIKLKTPIDG